MTEPIDHGPVTVSGGPLTHPVRAARVIHRNGRVYVFTTRNGGPKNRPPKAGRRGAVAAVFDAADEQPVNTGGVIAFGDLQFKTAGCKCQYGAVGIESSMVLVRDADAAVANGTVQVLSPRAAVPA